MTHLTTQAELEAVSRLLERCFVREVEAGNTELAEEIRHAQSHATVALGMVLTRHAAHERFDTGGES